MPKTFFLKLFSVLLVLLPLTGHAATPNIVVSIKPIHSLVAAVTENIVEPHLLLDGNQSPHDYALRPSDAKMINDADVIFFVSRELETSLYGMFGDLSNVQVVELANKDGIVLFPSRQTRGESHTHTHAVSYDPHLWLNPDNAVHMVNAIMVVLSEKDPVNALRYRRNAAAYIATLKKMAATLRKQLHPYKAAPYIVFHDAYQYFEHYFDIHSLGAIALSEDRSPSVKRVQEIHDLVKEYNARCMFVEPQFSPSVAEAIGKDIKISIGLLDPLGVNVQPGKDAYRMIMENIATNLTLCLNRE